jgi:hypothetical protein
VTIHHSAAAATPAAAAPALGISPGHTDTPAAAAPVLGISLGHADTAAAEHWLASLSPAPLLACTHLVREPRPHVALSLVFAGPAPTGLGTESAVAAAEHRAGSSGRAVRYPGVDLLVGTLSVAEVLELSAIEKIEVLGGGAADPATLLDTGDFVRPQWRAGVLTLTTTPAAGGRLVPFETRNPTPCCAAH